MALEIRMPSLGQTTEELRIVRWFKAEGDTVKLGEPLFEVETDKATLEVESFASGTLLKTLRGADEVVEAGEILAWIGQPGEDTQTLTPQSGKDEGGGLKDEGSGRCLHPSSFILHPSDLILALPMTRRLARRHGIPLSRVRGTGPGGRIEWRDVLALIEKRGGL